MPLSPKDVVDSGYLRLLVLGAPKSGKTHTIVATCEKPCYVIHCDDDGGMRPALRACKSFGAWDRATADGPSIFQQVENCIAEARKGVREDRYKTIILDPLSSLANRFETVLEAASDTTGKGGDGRRFWREYKKRLHSVIERLFLLPAHVIVTSHYFETGAEIEGQISKSGPGIVPMLAGQSRGTIPALFQDVVFLEKRKPAGRVFVTALEGVFGPGCRSLEGINELPADVAQFWKRCQAGK